MANSAESNNIPHMDNNIMLLNLPDDEEGVVISIHAGFKATQRLGSLGITPGTRVRKVSTAPFRGPVQIEVRNSKLALGRGLASRIIVQRLK